jgi:lipoprotein-anchoring transpeptidase ErfK/SrfK
MARWLGFRLPGAVLVALLAACTFDGDDDVQIDVERSAPPPPATAPSVPAPVPPIDTTATDMAIEVDLAAKKLFVHRGGSVTDSQRVAVGSEEWPTPTGEWRIHEVIWNPGWTPPDESWARNEVERKPGDPENPLGTVQLVYDRPNSIHGTNDPESIGKAVSHGSIRVTNEVGEALARDVMEAGGASRDESWFREVRANPTREYPVSLPRPVTIRVVERSDTSSVRRP